MGLPLPVILSPTRVELASRCLRRHLLADHLHLTLDDSPNPYAAFGTQIHLGVATWWEKVAVEGAPMVTALEAMLDAALQPWPDAATSGYHTEELARTLLTEYAGHGVLHAENVQSGWEVVDIESRRLIPLGDAWLSFQIDRLLRLGDKYLLVDTKTSGRPDARWENSFKNSVQQRLYSYGVGHIFDADPPEVWIEGLDKKNPGRIVYVHASEGWDNSFVNEAYILASSKANQVLDMYDLAQEMADLDENGDVETMLAWMSATVAPFNLMDCHSYRHPCPYLDICSSQPNARKGLMATYQKAEPWDAESRALLAE